MKLLKNGIKDGNEPSRQPVAALQLDLPLFSLDALAPAPTAPQATPPHEAALLRPAEPTPLVLAPHQRSVILSGQTLVYRFKRSPRRTIGFLIDDEGLSITAPKWVTLAEVESAIQQKQKWIFQKLGEWQARQAKHQMPTMTWNSGAQIPYLGKTLTLQIDSHNGCFDFDAERATLSLGLPLSATEQQIKDRVQSWLQQQAKTIYAERLAVYAEKLNVRFHSFALSSANTRWGSCTVDGKIRLSWRLIHFSVSVIDYVVAHELAHLKEMNHGPRFWQTVASVFPDYDTARDTLKQHPPSLFPAF